MMEVDEIRNSIPSHYSDSEKDEIIILLTDLAEIYLDIENES